MLPSAAADNSWSTSITLPVPLERLGILQNYHIAIQLETSRSFVCRAENLSLITESFDPLSLLSTNSPRTLERHVPENSTQQVAC